MQAVVALTSIVFTVGYLAPQTYSAMQGKDLEKFSFRKYLLIAVTALLWLIHGSNTRDAALIFASILVTVCAGIIVFIKYKYGKKGGGSYRKTSVRRRR